MNPILLSFLCGAAFIGGATATTMFVVLAFQLKDKKGRQEIIEYWHRSIANHVIQIQVLTRIAVAVEELAADGTAAAKRKDV